MKKLVLIANTVFLLASYALSAMINYDNINSLNDIQFKDTYEMKEHVLNLAQSIKQNLAQAALIQYPHPEAEQLKKLIDGIEESGFNTDECHEVGLNQKYKNFFYNGHYKGIFSAHNLKNLIALQSIYDEKKDGLSYKNLEFDSLTGSLAKEDFTKNGVLFRYWTMHATTFLVTPYSVLNGILNGIESIWDKAVKAHRFATERENIWNGLVYIQEELAKARLSLTTNSIIEDTQSTIQISKEFTDAVIGELPSLSIDYKTQFSQHILFLNSATPYGIHEGQEMTPEEMKNFAQAIKNNSSHADIKYAALDKIIITLKYILTHQASLTNPEERYS